MESNAYRENRQIFCFSQTVGDTCFRGSRVSGQAENRRDGQASTVDGSNPAPVAVGSLSYYLLDFVPLRWCRISEPSTVLALNCYGNARLVHTPKKKRNPQEKGTKPGINSRGFRNRDTFQKTTKPGLIWFFGG